jgi:hypothetical protein
VSVAKTSVLLVSAAALLVALAGCAGTPAKASGTLSAKTTAAASRSNDSGSGNGASAISIATATQMIDGPAKTKVPQASPFCAGNRVGTRHIYVNIELQHLWACSGVDLYLDTAVTTGAWKLTHVNDATPIGTFHIYGKARNVVLSGHDYYGSWHDHVAYWMPFYGPYGFHDASWQKFPFGSSLYKTEGSHGCVHVPVSVLGEIFNWAPIGTAVTIVRS